MTSPSPPDADSAAPENRSSPRVLVTASALLLAHRQQRATQHLVYDLSAGGMRLCGVPAAGIGDPLDVRLELPSGPIHVCGHLLRTRSMRPRSDFALEFDDLTPHAEDAIHDAVLNALAQPERPSLLLVTEGDPRKPAWEWLSPVMPSCLRVGSACEAVEQLEEQRIGMGVFSPAQRQLPDWAQMYPEVAWRRIDAEGRLFPLSPL